MRMRRFTLACYLALAPASAFAGTIGVAFPRPDDTFFNVLRGSIVQRAKEKGVTLKMADAGNDAARQIQAVKEFVSAKVDAILVPPVDGDTGPQISRIAADAGIPLVYVNVMPSNIEDLPTGQAFVASDEADSGTLQAREVCRRLGGQGTAVVLMGELLHFAARQRSDDIAAVFAGDDCRNIKVVERQSANWSSAQAETQINEWLAAGVKFDAVIANNDEMALGAIRAMKAAGLSMKKIVVAGIDATADGLAAMAAGDLDVTVFQDAAAQGVGGLDAAIALASGVTVPAKTYVPFELVTPENAARFAARN